MQIIVRTDSGESLPLQVEPNETIDDVIKRISRWEGVPPYKLRLLFDGERLIDVLTVAESNIQQDDVVDLSLEQTGMISSFTSSDETDPLIRYLMLTDEERSTAIVPFAALRAKAEEYKSHPYLTFNLDRAPGILSLLQCNWLSCFLDYMWTATQREGVNRMDMKLVVPDNLFLELMGAIITPPAQVGDDITPPWVFHKLKRSFASVHGSKRDHKIAFRMTKGPTEACINFHCDGGYATATCQVALSDPNSDYKGGKLCYFVNDILHVLEDRPIGSIVSHPRAVLHAVTTVTEGSRKSLFVVDSTNGLGEANVIDVKQQHVTDFRANVCLCSNSGFSHIATHTCGT
jgi:ubiquitin-large subunit ribosomal protein L40e